jgi:putative solute:sodium symporter small subunit
VNEVEARRQAYWRDNLQVIGILLVVWAAASFLPGWFAEDLQDVELFGWPLGFFMAAQGSLCIFLFIVWFYDRWMIRLERRHGLARGDD